MQRVHVLVGAHLPHRRNVGLDHERERRADDLLAVGERERTLAKASEATDDADSKIEAAECSDVERLSVKPARKVVSQSKPKVTGWPALLV